MGKWDEHAIARVTAQLAEGHSIAEIARLHGISRPTLYAACHRHGVTLPYPRKGGRRIGSGLWVIMTTEQREKIKRAANTRRVSEAAVLRGLIDNMEVE